MYFIWIRMKWRMFRGRCICQYRWSSIHESRKAWIKRMSCEYHWNQTSYGFDELMRKSRHRQP